MNDTATIGHNLPPEDQLTVQLHNDHKGLFDRLQQLIAKLPDVPRTVDTEEQAQKVQDFYKQARVAVKMADETRKIEYEPYKKLVDQVNATFNIPKEKLSKGMKDIKEGLDKYLNAKAEREKAEREEKMRREREESERLQREAQEAERARIAAEQEKQRAIEAAERAQREREEAEQRAKDEAIRAENARKERQRLEAERKERDAREAAERAQREVEQQAEREERAKVEAERQKAHEARMAELKAEEEDAETKRRAEREAAKKSLEQRRQADDEAREAGQDARAAAKDEKLHMAGAVRSERIADRHERSSMDDADMSRTRSERGSLSSLQKKWEIDIVDIDKLPKDILWPHISHDAIRAAVWKWMMNQPNDEEHRKMVGASIERVTSAQVR